jgi:HK97 family phage major capsid protein
MPTELTQIKELIEEQQKAFHEFKATNDERLKELEKGSTGVAELEGKLEKINAELDRLDEIKAEIDRVETLAARPEGVAALGERAKAAAEHKKAFAQFVRKGIDNGLQDLEIQAAVSTGTDADGGYAIPEELDRQILSLLTDGYAMRRLANVITLGGGEYKKIVNLHGAASGWVGETDARTETGTPALAALTPFMGEIYAYPMSTQKALDDVFFDVEGWLVDECTLGFSEEEGGAFVSGDGSKKPKGFLAYTTSTDPDGTRAFGTLQHRETAAASTIGFDDVIDLEYDLKEGHLSGAVYLAKRSTVRVLRKLKDNDNNYIWQPSAQAGEPSMLNGYPFYTDPGMPALADNAFALAFGNFRRGYTIVDRLGTRVLRDPYTNKPYVGFYITKRVGGFVADSEAIKLLKIQAAI